MPTRLVGVDSTDPKLPDSVITATEATEAEVMAYSDGGFITPRRLPTIPVYPGATAAQINAIWATYPNATVEMQGGDYGPWTEPAVIDSNQGLIANGTVTIQVAPGVEGLTSVGAIATATAFTVDHPAQVYALTLPSGAGAGFSVDDLIVLRAEVAVSTRIAHDPAFARELHWIVGVSGDTLTLDRPLEFNYLVANSASFARAEAVRDIVVRGLQFYRAPGEVPTVATVSMRRLLRGVMDVTTVDASTFAVTDAIGTEVKCNATNSRPLNAADGAWGYGFALSGSGYGVEVRATGRNCRHVFTTLNPTLSSQEYTGPMGANVYGVGWGANIAGAGGTYDTHPHCYDIQFHGVLASGMDSISQGAFHDRGHRTRWFGCKGRSQTRVLRIDPDSRDAAAIGCDFEATAPSSGGTCVFVQGLNFRMIGGKLKGRIGVTLSYDPLGVPPSGTEVKGVDAETTAAFWWDNGGDDVLSLAEGNTLHLMGGYGFMEFAGTARGNSRAPDSTRPLAAMIDTLDSTAVWEDAREVFIPATAFAAGSGSPVLSTNTTIYTPGWQMDAAATESIVTTIDVLDKLPGWRTCEVRLQWSNSTTGSGNIRARLDARRSTPGDATASLTNLGSATIAASTDQWKSVTNILNSSMTITGTRLTLRVLRMGSVADVLDTKTGDASFEGVVLTRLT